MAGHERAALPVRPAPEPLRRSVSESILITSALSHLIRAEPVGRLPLPRVPPRSPRLASWSSFAEQTLVEDGLRSLLRAEKVSERRKRIYEKAAALRDYEAGRSPPQNIKLSQARAALLLQNFGTSIDDVRDKLAALPPIPPAPPPALSIAAPSVSGSPDSPAAATPAVTRRSSQDPGGAYTDGGLRMRYPYGEPHPGASALSPQPHTCTGVAASVPGPHVGGAPATPGVVPPQPLTCAYDATATTDTGPGPDGRNWGGGAPTAAGAASPTRTSAPGTSSAAAPTGAAPAADKEPAGPMATFPVEEIRRVADQEVADRSVGRQTRRAATKAAPITRLEIMEGIRENATMRELARSALQRSETLNMRGSLQRRDLLPPAQQQAALQHALLSPRDGHGSPASKKTRRRTSGTSSDAAAPGSPGSPIPGSGAVDAGTAAGGAGAKAHSKPTMAAQHIAALDSMHTLTVAQMNGDPLPEPPKAMVTKELAAKEGAALDASRQRGAKPHKGVLVDSSGAKEEGSPGRRVGFVNEGRTGPTTPQHRGYELRRRSLSPTFGSSPAPGQEALWQVANRPGDAELGIADQQVEAEELGKLPSDAFVWTEGLADWLPLGPLPPPEQIPHPPLRSSPGPGESSPDGSPPNGRTSPAV